MLLSISSVVEGAEPAAPQTLVSGLGIDLLHSTPVACHFGSGQILNILIVGYQQSIMEPRVSTQAL